MPFIIIIGSFEVRITFFERLNSGNSTLAFLECM